MSQFRDTSTKEDKKDNLLDYDDSASLYFVGTVLVCIIVPWTYQLLKLVFRTKKSLLEPYYPVKTKTGCTVAYCRCSACVEHRDRKTTEICSFSNKLRISTWVQLAILGVLWLGFAYTCTQLSHVEQIKTFDPFEILGIEAGLDDKGIKKAYRTMSLRYHPDKNPNDPTAAAKFMLISKAYQSLTDEIAKRNFEKYGNPDGPGVMKIGIGLPRFLVDEKNQLPILCLFFVLLLVVIPLLFICYYNHQRKYRNGVQMDTYHVLVSKMSQTTRCKNMPELLAASAESQEMIIRSSDESDMSELTKEVTEHVKRQHSRPIVIRNTLLILGHMQRLHTLMTPDLLDDVNELLGKALPITNAMLEVALSHGWTQAAQSVVEFRRCLVQAIDIKDSTLVQLPHCNVECAKAFARGKNGARELPQFLANRAEIMEDTQKIKTLTPEQVLDMEAMAKHVSDIEVNAHIFVTDEQDIVVGDVATAAVTMTRKNLQENEALGAVHAPLFPDVKFEEWIILLIDKRTGEIQGSPIRSKSGARVVEERIKFSIQRPGPQTFCLLVMSDSYAGLDKTIDIPFKVCTQQEKPREIYVHPEDEELDDQPSYIRQLMGPAVEVEESSDEEEEIDRGGKANQEAFAESSSDSE